MEKSIVLMSGKLVLLMKEISLLELESKSPFIPQANISMEWLMMFVFGA